MEFIENNYLKVTVNELGGTLLSIIDKKRDVELLYQIKEGSWQFQDVQMFPLIGAGEFIYNNRTYKFPMRHGIIRDKIFNVNKINKSTVELVYSPNQETLNLYPFDFTFSITYKLVKNTLKVKTKIDVANDVYYSYGSHTGLKIYKPKSVQLFKNLEKIVPICGVLSEKTAVFDETSLAITKQNFEQQDTYVFKNTKRKIVLDNGNNYLIKLKFNSPLFAIWTNPNTLDFICIEPWWGISNYENESSNLKDRLYINRGPSTFKYGFTFINKD